MLLQPLAGRNIAFAQGANLPILGGSAAGAGVPVTTA